MATLTTTFQKIATTKYTVTGSNELRLYAKYNSQNASNLKTNVTFELRTQALSGSFYSEDNNAILKIDNVNKGTKSYDIGTVTTSTEKTLATWSFDITHTSSGTYNGTAEASANVYGSLNPSVSVEFSLPNIAVNPTLVINSTGVMTVNYGSSINYTLGSTNGRTIKLQYLINNSTWTDWHTRNADGTYTYALPSLVSSFPNTYTPTIYFRAITSDGNYSSGSKSKQVTIDSNIKPSLNANNITLTPINSYSQISGLFVQTLSGVKIQAQGTAYANGGASINKYDLTALGGYNSNVTKSNMTITNSKGTYEYTPKLQKSDSITAKVKVYDTRGGNAEAISNSVTVIPYSTPSITSISVKRCTSNGTLSDTGTYCKLTVAYKIAPINDGTNNKNTKSLKYKIGSGSWNTISISSYNTTISTVIGGSLSTNSSYQISVQLQDLTTTVTQVVTLPTSFVLVSKRAGGKGIAFGAIAESNGFHNHMTTNLYDTLNMVVNGTVIPILEIVDE